MDRTSSRHARLAFALASVAAAVAIGVGCNFMATMMYVANGTDQKAEFDGLVGKKIAVVCRPVVSLQYRNANVHKDLAKEVGDMLSKNVKKLTVIDSREVEKWTDENNWEEFTQIGTALNADLVVAIELDEFGLYQGQTLYQGTATVHVAVYDMKQNGKQVWQKFMPQTHFPPNTAVPASEKPEAEFRRQFVSVLSDIIARHFYDHDGRIDFASDASFYNN